MKMTIGLGALASALILGTALVSAPAFAQDTTVAAHHHRHHHRRMVSEPQMPPQPAPCIHMGISCP
jgi:hypothetical protein